MKKYKKIQLKTKHLCISPKTLEELKLALEKETDPEMQKAYGDMIRGVEEQPEDWLWYTDWTITLKGTETLVGSIGFKGSANESGEVEVGYGIEEEHRRKGYGLEAVNVMMEWAFQNEKVYYIMAETLADNTASQRLLEKAGFTPTGTIGEEGPRFEKEKPQTSFTSLLEKERTGNMNITEEIREELQKSIDEEYRKFHGSLVPDMGEFLGVRVPKLRQLAKQAAKEGYREFAVNANPLIYEELMIRGMMIGYGKLSMEEQQEELKKFIPLINNWAICDCCCATYKFMKKDQREWFSFLEAYLAGTGEYEVRFAIVCMLDFFINETYIDEVLERLAGISRQEYYVKMAAAWALSVCYVKFPKKTECILEREALDEEIRRKAVQKIRESLRVTKEEKERLKQKFAK